MPLDIELQYASKLEMICRFSNFPREGPTEILDFLYLGGMGDAENIQKLSELGITHIVNCAEGYIHTGPKFYGEEFKYLGFRAEDDWGYNIMKHFEDTYEFIEDARTAGGKVLIHCQMGVNRSGALATAYVMVHQNVGPLSAARLVKDKRKLLLTNEHFQRQLISLSKEKNLLTLDEDQVKGSAHI